MSLDNTYKTMMFWIVSRVNNCQYCLGHQEVKLFGAGVDEDRIAALDGDWREFTPAEQAAFAFTHKLTYRPHEVGQADLDALRKHYTGVQALEIAFAIGGFNGMNRWTDSLGIPQEEKPLRGFSDGKREFQSFLDPVAPAYRGKTSVVAPLSDRKKEKGAEAAIANRPTLESREQVLARFEEGKTRKPRIALVDEKAARESLPPTWGDAPLPDWVRLLAHFPSVGMKRAGALEAARTRGFLSARMKGEIAWVAARHDRAWYALHLAYRQLKDVGFSDDEIFALDGDAKQFTPAEREVMAFTRKLTVAPTMMTDADIANLQKHFTDREVGEIVHRVTNAAFFHRVTEPFSLSLAS